MLRGKVVGEDSQRNSSPPERPRSSNEKVNLEKSFPRPCSLAVLSYASNMGLTTSSLQRLSKAFRRDELDLAASN